MTPSIPILLLLASFLVCIHCAELKTDKVSSLSTRRRYKRNEYLPSEYRISPPGRDVNSLPLDAAINDLELLDVVILASVDGKLHGLNRTTGQTLWSMSDDPGSSQPSSSTFDSLVRTQHSGYDSDREFFIIEPQSGDIYVLPLMATPSDPLQRLPFSMQQLVEMSPFNFPGDEHRVFVGKNKTNIIIIELDTGKVKGTVNADKECFWDYEQGSSDEIDLDELDGTKPPKHKLQFPEIHIGRTDYHVRVHSRHQGVVQNLVYSSYGPNNIDRDKQSKWTRTPDNLYIQPLPNGQTLAFQTDGTSRSNDYYEMPIWGRKFRQPIVAIFDIVTTPSRSNPLALLQPRPRLEHLLPYYSSRSFQTPHNLPETTYVGLVGDSLYAMGHTNFPLVVFDQEPPRMAIPEGDVSVSYQCLVGTRKFEPNSQWYPPPLLDVVPNIPGLEGQVSLDHIIQSESPSSDGDTKSRLIADIGEEGRQTYEEAQLGKWGIIGLAAMLFVALAKYFMGNRRVSPPI